MWNKILIGALVLFLFAAYLFYNTFQQVVGTSGEIENIQTQQEQVINEATLIAVDERNKLYAEMRKTFFNAEQKRFEDEKAALDEETENTKQEIATTTAQYEELRAEYEKLQEEIKNLMEMTSKAAGLEASGADVDTIVREIVTLTERSNELRADIASKDARINSLNSQNDHLTGLVKDGRKLNSDRQSRLSPEDLSCRILLTDPNWDYVVIDAGINKGIVVGSRLAIMRGGEKICEVSVKNVEGNRTSADIVYDTLKPGERIYAGDTVKSVRYN